MKRYEPSNQEKRTEYFLSNKYTSSEGQVNIYLEDEKGKETVIKRTTQKSMGNDFNPGKLSIGSYNARDVDDILVKSSFKEEINFSNSFNFSHFLSQELVSDFIRRYKATERYSVLSNLAGIRNYSLYTDKFKEIEKEK